jgi:uncharacterized protein with HEPN domain
MQRDAATLLDIVKAAQLVQTFLGASTKADFMSDIKTQSAVVYQLTIIGEAVKRLSRPFRDEHSHVPWALIAGMRDHLIHGYDALDLDEVW